MSQFFFEPGYRWSLIKIKFKAKYNSVKDIRRSVAHLASTINRIITDIMYTNTNYI